MQLEGKLQHFTSVAEQAADVMDDHHLTLPEQLIATILMLQALINSAKPGDLQLPEAEVFSVELTTFLHATFLKYAGRTAKAN